MTLTISGSSVQAMRNGACLAFMCQAHKILNKEGSSPSGLHALKLKLAALAARAELFPVDDFPMPVAEARVHSLLVEDNDGLAMYLITSMPGKISNPHSHGIWCINASIKGRERNVYWRRTDDGLKPGYATLTPVGEMVMERGHGFAMGDLDIHSQEVLGEEPSIILALYGYAFERFPSISWYNSEFSSVRKMPSRRGQAAA